MVAAQAFASTITAGAICARMAAVALEKRQGDETGLYRARPATARFYMTRILPHTSSLFATTMAGKKPMMEMEAELF